MEGSAIIIDDDPVVQTILAAILDSFEINSQCADSGASGLALLKQSIAEGRRPALVFLDMMLQDMTGIEVLKEIRALGDLLSGIPVVMLSANSKEEVMGFAGTTPPDEFLEKPFTATAVGNLLRESLGLIT
jgi:CheY-like chemotaxis protein